jgi:hypothetical protein
MRLTQKGFSLTELVVTIGVSVFLLLILVQTMDLQSNLGLQTDTKSEIHQLSNIIALSLLDPTMCNQLLTGQAFGPLADPARTGLPVVLNFRAAGVKLPLNALIQEGYDMGAENNPVYRLAILESRLRGGQEMSDPTSMSLERFFAVSYSLGAKMSANTSMPSYQFKPRNIIDIVVRTNLAGTQITGCYDSNFSYRRRCANYGMVYIPTGFNGTPADFNGCVPLSALR